MTAEINQAAQNLSKADTDSLYARLGASAVEFPKDPQKFAAANAAMTINVATAGPLDDLVGLGKRILQRWNKTIYELVCGDGGGGDAEAKKTILDALKLGKPDAVATAITSVLVGFFSVGPGVALVVGVLFGKLLIPAAGQEVCAFWKERL